MSEQNRLQPLALIANEVEESQSKLDLVNFCIKAQQDLSHKLRKEAQRRKETCGFIRNNNLQLESEIRCAEQQIKSMLSAYDTIKIANVELKKELLLADHNNSELIQRMKEGETRYEQLWLVSKARYESLPYVQKWLQAINKTDTLKHNLNALSNDATIIQLAIKNREKVVQDSDRKQIIRLAEFLVREMPAKLKIIKEKSSKITALVIEIENMKRSSVIKTTSIKAQKLREEVNDVKNSKMDDKWSVLTHDDTLMMPKLRLASSEIDVLSFKLELDKAFYVQTYVSKRTDDESNSNKNAHESQTAHNTSSDYISTYFKKPIEDKVESYSQKKLINILEDVQLDKSEAYDIVSKINPVQLMEVDEIAAEPTRDAVKERKVPEPMQSDEIEEIDLTKTSSQNILLPPTQFVDLTQENIMTSTQQHVQVIVHMGMDESNKNSRLNTSQQIKNSQEKRKVSFNIPLTMPETQEDENVEVEDSTGNIADITNETITSVKEADISSANDESFMKMKDMILKKHHLDLSPQFIYAKNTTMFKQKNDDDNIITSKFFYKSNETPSASTHANEQDKVAETIDEVPTESNNIEIPVEDRVIKEACTSPKTSPEKPKPVSGLLFTHGTQIIPESLNVSMSTTGFEDGDGQYAHVLDNSLLLSPKGDMMADNNNCEGASQELPNFLSGIKKTGLFFFGQHTKESNAESNHPTQNQENTFNFNFGSQEKKNKGLFSFFR